MYLFPLAMNILVIFYSLCGYMSVSLDWQGKQKAAGPEDRIGEQKLEFILKVMRHMPT